MRGAGGGAVLHGLAARPMGVRSCPLWVVWLARIIWNWAEHLKGDRLAEGAGALSTASGLVDLCVVGGCPSWL